MTNQPPHYPEGSFDLIVKVTNNCFYWGNILKYIIRYDKKDGVKDLRKAKDYFERHMNKFPDHPPKFDYRASFELFLLIDDSGCTQFTRQALRLIFDGNFGGFYDSLINELLKKAIDP